jgi:TRAP-type C4-dicarboxylate transport system permease small subunit
MENILNKVDKVLGYFLMTLMALMVVDVTWQVVTRFILSTPSSFTEELARFFLVWIGLLGAAYAYRTGAHLGLDLLTANMQPVPRRRTAIVSNLVCFIFAALVMVYGGLSLVSLMLELGQTSSALQVKIGYVYSVIPLSGFLICIYALDNIRRPGSHLPTETQGESAQYE